MFRRVLPSLVAVLTVSGLAACSGESSDDGPTSAAGTRATQEISWEKVQAPEDCQCSDGSEFHYWLHRGDADRVVLFLEGGGACFSAETCAPGEEAIYTTDLEGRLPDRPAYGRNAADEGLLDLDNPENPLAGASVVYVPYCTGDLHLGTATHDYGDVVVEHKGRLNATAALETLAAEFPGAEEVVVLGQSAGSAAAPLYGGLAHDLLPEAQVTVLADASGAYPADEVITSAIGGLWGIFDQLPAWPEAAGDPLSAWSLPGLFIQTSEHVPGIRLASINTADDEVQRDFSDRIGQQNTPLSELIGRNNELIEAAGVDLAWWLGPGDKHVSTSDDELYDTEVDGIRLVDWIAGVLAGKDVADVRG
ncbi:pectin acetylesterase-family hydrolase [Candidatus Blastococcus massiliensis]|uniref:pectin acetylesterase-family hydrolase n=1 Tax=Candidatus Blastococcus massiliensis TaxID=1470358 RepID=UPI0004B4D526|nr:pectin acetylesterase-family hydrolase [Candidatus Blastococcus massiliensis]